MCLTVHIDREEDGRWIAEVPELPGVLQRFTLGWHTTHTSPKRQRGECPGGIPRWRFGLVWSPVRRCVQSRGKPL
jgi:hypothetical protein